MTIPNDFPWRPGMRILPTDDLPALRVSYVGPHESFGPDIIGQAYAEDPDDVDAYVFDGTDQPDLTDPATLGALEQPVREAWSDPALYAVPVMDEEQDGPIAWSIRQPARYGSHERGRGVTRGEAWLAAWNARPVRS